MSPTIVPYLPKAHGHKVIFVYASHRQILLPSTFRLLHHIASYDAVLKAYLDSAYQSLRHEAQAAADSAQDGQPRAPPLPNTFTELAEVDLIKSLLPYKISLTTLAQVAVVLASRQDFKDAMREDFPAVWDPESFLTMQLLQKTDVTSTLDLIAKAVEVVKLACWLDFYLDSSMHLASGTAIGKQQVAIRGDRDAIASAAESCGKEGTPLEETLCGFAIGLCRTANLEDIQLKGVADQMFQVVAIDRSTVPILDDVEWSQFAEELGHRVLLRQIRVNLKNDPTSSPQSHRSGHIHIDLQNMFTTVDVGRSQKHFQNAAKLLEAHLNGTRIYAPCVNLLLLGGAMDDACAMRITRAFDSHQTLYKPVKLLHLLYPKDNHRFGDEPVKLSKVQGNPCEQVAIVGMSCRVPGANDADELWQLLKEGKDMCEEIPGRLYRCQDYHSASYRDRNVMRVKTGNFVACSSLFDKSILGEVASVSDCSKLDPQQRVAILTAHETLQRAGYGFSPHQHPRSPEQWSTHLAYCSDDYREHLSQSIEADFVPSTHRAHLVARVNEVFGFRGEACTYDTACSSALVAVEAACNSLLSGETSAAITGGINILLQPQITIGLDRGFFLSASSQCMTLDDAGAGYSRADAVSIMLLKRLTDAVRDGDPILALISSAATNHSGESFSITHPHGPTQKRLYQSGMLASKTLPHDYSYIEMHGTGTQSGDFEEVTGIVQTFGEGKRGEESPLVLGSVKANIGHSEAASGASSMIKTVQIYEHGEVPRHVGIRTKLNTKLPPLDGLHVPLQETKLDRVDSAFTLVDNFSAAGGNSSIVMDRGSIYRERLQKMDSAAREEEASQRDPSVAKNHLLLVTAATPFSLDAKRRRLITYLEANKDVNLAEFCSAVSISDPMYPFRLIGTPSSLLEVKTCLSSQESVCIHSDGVDKKERTIGVALSGQGAQYLDMARELYENSAAFRAHIDNCGTIAMSLGLPNLVEVVHPLHGSQETRKADSVSPAQYQLALIATEIGLATMLLDWGLKPSCVVGHSLGEYAALWLSGIISLRSLLDLVGRRAMLMMELCVPNATSMLAVREGQALVRELLEQSGYRNLEIACLNSPKDTVVAGGTDDIEKLLRLCEHNEPKIKAMAIPVPYAFHSMAVEPLMERYGEIAAGHRFSKPKISIVSNVLGQLLGTDSDAFDAGYLVRHLRQPVRFSESISALQSKIKVDTWIEIGPHPTCIPMLKGCYAESEQTPAFLSSFRRGSSSWSSTLDLVKELAARGIELDWSKVFGDLGLGFCHHGLSASLPLYAFDLEEYWIPFKDRGLRDHLTITRGDPGSSTAGNANGTDSTEAFPMKLPRPAHALLSQCVRLDAKPPTALFLVRVNQRPFSDFIRGHIILGVPLAPATVFVELAQEAGMYWWRTDPCSTRPTNQQEEEVVMEVLELSMVASLYLNEHDPKQSVEVSMQGSPSSVDGSIVQFFSHSEHQHQKHQYGSCRVRIASVSDITREWKKLSHLVSTTADTVKLQRSTMIKTHTIYKTFETIVLYKDGFRGMNTIWMSKQGDEATSEVRCHPEAVNGRFLCSPMLLDSLGGLTGFISNVGFAEGPFVYMAETIGRVVTMPELRQLQPGSETKVQVYARMEQDKELSKGSAYFFLPDGQLMGMMEGIIFKRIRRDMLSRLVQLSSKSFANEAAKMAKDKKEKAAIKDEVKGGSTTTIAAQAQIRPCPAKEIETNTAPPVTVHPAHPAHQPQRDSPMDELTNPNRRLSCSNPLHIGGPQVRHFDGQNVLFLFPDGSGSAQIYPKIAQSGGLSVYGFDSPYLGLISAWSRGIAELVDRYVEILCHVQTKGPYKLAGWSIGGVFALEVARRLLSAGHEVAFLGLIDTPSPRQIKPLPTDTLDEMLKKITSSTIREHFRSCALTLPGYRCIAFSETDRKPGEVVVVNASDASKLKNVMADEQEWRSFWSSSANLTCHEVKGDHWTCLEPALEHVVGSAQ